MNGGKSSELLHICWHAPVTCQIQNDPHDKVNCSDAFMKHQSTHAGPLSAILALPAVFVPMNPTQMKMSTAIDQR